MRERARRQVEIVAMRDMGVTWGRIAAEHGISTRQAQNIARDWYAAERDTDKDDRDPVESLLSLLRAVCQEYVVILRRSVHDGYRVSALRGLVDVAIKRWEIERIAGLAPSHPAMPRISHQMQLVFQEFAELLRRHDISDEALQELLELAERAAVDRPR